MNSWRVILQIWWNITIKKWISMSMLMPIKYLKGYINKLKSIKHIWHYVWNNKNKIDDGIYSFNSLTIYSCESLTIYSFNCLTVYSCQSFQIIHISFLLCVFEFPIELIILMDIIQLFWYERVQFIITIYNLYKIQIYRCPIKMNLLAWWIKDTSCPEENF